MHKQKLVPRTLLPKWTRELRVTWLLASLVWIGTVLTGIALSWLLTMQNLGNEQSPWTRCDATTGRIFSDLFSTCAVLFTLFLLLPMFGRNSPQAPKWYKPPVTKTIMPVLLSWTIGAFVNTGGISVYSYFYCPNTNMISPSTVLGDILIRLSASVFVLVPVIYAGSVEKSLRSAYQELAETSSSLLEAAEAERINLFDLVHGDIQGTLLGLEILANRQSTSPIKEEFFGLEVSLIAHQLRTGPVAQVANLIGPVRILGTVETSILQFVNSLDQESAVDVSISSAFTALEQHQDSHHFDENFKRLIVRISQELILNAVKHGTGEGNQLSIDAEKFRNELFACVTMSNISQELEFTPGRGLTEVSSRARLAGGSFSAIQTNDCFKVEAIVPIPSPKNHI